MYHLGHSGINLTNHELLDATIATTAPGIKLQSSPLSNYAQKVIQMPQLSEQIRMIIKEENILGQADYTGCPIYFIKHCEVYFQGNWKNRLPNGFGKAIYPDKSYYQGSFIDGSPSGSESLLIYPNLSKYVGEFSNCKPEGQGIYTNHDFKFEGQWLNGKPFKGTQTYPDGSQYKGQYKNGIKNGEGFYKCRKDGFTYQGQFKNGKMNGAGIYKKGNLIYKGKFYNGKLIELFQIMKEEQSNLFESFFNDHGQNQNQI